MKRCIVITSYQPHGLPDHTHITTEDLVLCADGGYLYAKQEGLHPDYVIGDFDSDNLPHDFSIQRDLNGIAHFQVPPEKDDTDTMLCIKHGINCGCDDFIIVGGIGGRLDHTISNIQSLAYLLELGKTAMLTDPFHQVFLLPPGTRTFAKENASKFSLFSYTQQCLGVTLSNAKYPLQDAVLNNSFPLGVSNEFLKDTVEIVFTSGQLLVILSSGAHF